LQKKSDELDQDILKKRVRTTDVEPPVFVKKVKEKDLPEFQYPVPDSFMLDNGLEVVYLHRPNVPKVSLALGFKADYLYDKADASGLSRFMSRLLLEGTRRYSGQELNRYLESQGISLSADSGIVSLELLSRDFVKGLDILYQVVAEPTFKADSIEKIRQQTLMELQEYWDTPSIFVNALARDVVYKGHPYAKSRLGHKESVARFSRDQIFDCHERFVSPEGAFLVVVGDLSGYDEKALKRVMEKHLGAWKGPQVDELIFPEIAHSEPQVIHHEINRDQVVLAFAAPSVSRLDQSYDAMAVLDFILTGAGISSGSRLFQLREQTGLFYSIGGSLVHGAGRGPGMILLKTMVSLDKVEIASELIKKS